MKGGKTPLGYTVVEVMIVLAISGVMFLIASNFVNGKQERTAFTQGVNDFANRLQSVADQVSDGQFSDVSLPACNVNAATFVTFSGVANQAQGTNNKCVFLGKLLYFYADGSTYAQKYSQFVLAGALRSPIPPYNPFSDLTSYRNYISAVSTSDNQLTTIQDTPQSLEIRKMFVTPVGGSRTENYSIGFIQGLGKTKASDVATYETGSQTISMVYSNQLGTEGYNGTSDNFVSIVPNRVNRRIFYASKVEICISDNVRQAIITMDVQNDGLNVDVNRLDSGGATCSL